MADQEDEVDEPGLPLTREQKLDILNMALRVNSSPTAYMEQIESLEEEHYDAVCGFLGDVVEATDQLRDAIIESLVD